MSDGVTGKAKIKKNSRTAPVVRASGEGYAVVLGRTVFLDNIKTTKKGSIADYIRSVDPGWTWKRLYSLGARCIPVSYTIRNKR